MLEAADLLVPRTGKKLLKVQFPLSLPTIMGGVNQTIMLALSMVVIASMIGVQELGPTGAQGHLQPVLHPWRV